MLFFLKKNIFTYFDFADLVSYTMRRMSLPFVFPMALAGPRAALPWTVGWVHGRIATTTRWRTTPTSTRMARRNRMYWSGWASRTIPGARIRRPTSRQRAAIAADGIPVDTAEITVIIVVRAIFRSLEIYNSGWKIYNPTMRWFDQKKCKPHFCNGVLHFHLWLIDWLIDLMSKNL